MLMQCGTHAMKEALKLEKDQLAAINFNMKNGSIYEARVKALNLLF